MMWFLENLGVFVIIDYNVKGKGKLVISFSDL